MNNDATVTLSLEDFDELRRQSKSLETLRTYLSGCMEIDLADYSNRVLQINNNVRNMTNQEYDKALGNLLNFATIKINKPLLQRALFDSYKPKNIQEEMVIDEGLFEKDDLEIEYMEEEK